MKVLSIGTDRNLFVEGSAVRERAKEYGTLFEEMHIVVFSRAFLRHKKIQIASNVWAYPTGSWFKIFYLRDALNVCKHIIHEMKLTAQDTVVTCQDPFETGLVGKRIKKAFGMPLHLQVHTDMLSPYFLKESFLNKRRVGIARKIIPQADAVRVVSQRIADSFAAAGVGGPKPAVLPIFVDRDKIEAASITTDLRKKYPQFNFIILIASRLTREKNIPLALRTLAKITKGYPQVGMIIVGTGPEKSTLTSLVAELGLTHNVVFEPWQSDLTSYYKTANLFLVTSDYEGYGMTIVEAICAHCPTISTDVGIAQQVLKDGDSFVCPVRDEACMFDKIKTFIENNQMRSLFIQEASERVGAVMYPSKSAYLEQYRASIEAAAKKGAVPAPVATP